MFWLYCCRRDAYMENVWKKSIPNDIQDNPRKFCTVIPPQPLRYRTREHQFKLRILCAYTNHLGEYAHEHTQRHVSSQTQLIVVTQTQKPIKQIRNFIGNSLSTWSGVFQEEFFEVKCQHHYVISLFWLSKKLSS